MSKSKSKSTRLEGSWLDGVEVLLRKVSTRLVVCVVSRWKYKGNDSGTAIIIPGTSERNSSLPIAPPVLSNPSYFASHPCLLRMQVHIEINSTSLGQASSRSATIDRSEADDERIP